MELIDEEGRLFGIVNVIDALVLLLVIAVVVAGIAFVDPFAPSQDATRYATIELGQQPDYIANRVSTGDRMELENSPDNLTITDVYLGPAEEGIHVALRVRLNGDLGDSVDGGPAQFHFNEEPFFVGQEFTIETVDYTVKGNVTRVANESESLPVGTTSVVTSTTVSPRVAERLEVGDGYRVDGQSVAVIRSVQLYPTADRDGKLALLGLELSTLQRGSSSTFGSKKVQLGATVPFETDTYQLMGEVIQAGTTEFPGDQTAATATISVENVSPKLADNIRVGHTETIRGETLARIVEKDDQAAAVILTSDDGDIHERNHPQNRDLTLTVDIQARQTETNLWFHGEPVQVGDTVVLDLGHITIEGQITDLSS